MGRLSFGSASTAGSAPHRSFPRDMNPAIWINAVYDMARPRIFMQNNFGKLQTLTVSGYKSIRAIENL
jgi:hypothetical protein